MTKRVAVVLFNLGGPDSLEAVEPFLFNLFSDPAILRVPGLLRGFLARAISRRRAPVAKEIFAKMGGASPILKETLSQAYVLETRLAPASDSVRVFIAMRHWHPRAAQTAEAVAAYKPDEIVLLPLYPQFSTTTTASSLMEFEGALSKIGVTTPVKRICCWPQEVGFIAGMAGAIRNALEEARNAGPPRLLLSAHGLPERIVAAGDPYPWQVEQTAQAILAALGEPGLDALVCYQSRVGPLKWIGPETAAEVRRAGADGRALVVAPIAFVSEHSETLVELDMDYAELAREAGAKAFIRVPTVGIAPDFIAGLAVLTAGAMADQSGRRFCNPRICPTGQKGCPNA